MKDPLADLVVALESEGKLDTFLASVQEALEHWQRNTADLGKTDTAEFRTPKDGQAPVSIYVGEVTTTKADQPKEPETWRDRAIKEPIFW